MTVSFYEWQPIKDLVAGCAICDNLMRGCLGNPNGKFCAKYVSRQDAGQQCIDCIHFKPFNNLTHSESGVCIIHSAIVDSKDFCCNAFWGKRY